MNSVSLVLNGLRQMKISFNPIESMMQSNIYVIQLILIFIFHIPYSNPTIMNPPDLLNIDYNNIQDTLLLKNIIQSYNCHLDTIVKQMQQLSRIRDRKNTQNLVIINKMNAIQKQNQSKIILHDLQIQEATKIHQLKISQITEKHQTTLKNSEIKHLQVLDSLNDAIKKLQNQFSESERQQINNQQSKYQTEIKQKSSSLITQQYEHHDNMNKQELKQIEENKELFLKNRDMIKQLKRDVKMQAGRIVYQQKYQNQDKNYQLKAKLLELQDQVAKLRKQRNQIVKSRNDQKINVSLNQEEIQEYKAVGSIQKSKIKMYNDKIQSTKKTITAEISKLETKIKQKNNKWESELKGARLRYFNLEKKKQELKINLERYKLLGQTILMQREEVQQFFLMAIQSCKKQMSETRAMLDSTQKQYGEKVDIDELLPKDKHRIVTNLYTKLALAPTR